MMLIFYRHSNAGNEVVVYDDDCVAGDTSEDFILFEFSSLLLMQVWL